MNKHIHMVGAAIATVLALLVVTPDAAIAQSGAGDGYLFHTPRAALSMRLGLAVPNASDGVFTFASERLTLNRSDFAGFSAAVNLDFLITNRLSMELGTALSSREIHSEYRDWVDNNQLPIEQATRFQRMPLTAGLKYYLTPTGRSVGRYAWVPSKFAPYLSAGGGLMYYRFRQKGDFVDFETNDVFPSTLESTDWTSTAYGAAGVNYSLSTRMGLVTEARYDHASSPMGQDFQGFPRIDLSGLAVTTGLYIRF